MEIFSREATTVTIPMPTGFTDVTVELLDAEGNRVYYGNPESATSTSITAKIPYRATKIDSTLEMVVKFVVDGFQETVTKSFDVVTPLLTLDEVKGILSDDPADTTTARATDIERRVRIAIQTYTGQVFAPYSGILTVYGNNDTGLRLPRPIVTLESVNFSGKTATVLSNYTYLIKGNGMYLEAPSPLFWDIKDAPPDEVQDLFTNSVTSSGPIFAPRSNFSYNNFNSKIAYDIKGVFGYANVPIDVQQAARYLVNDYGCDESLWRDRYIDNIRAADWRFQFRAAAFDGTGNVQADQILEGYRPQLMSVI